VVGVLFSSDGFSIFACGMETVLVMPSTSIYRAKGSRRGACELQSSDNQTGAVDATPA
jgi:hypothetical protein